MSMTSRRGRFLGNGSAWAASIAIAAAAIAVAGLGGATAPAAGSGQAAGFPIVFRDRSAERLPATIGRLGRSMDAEPVDVDADGDVDWVVAKELGANVVLVNDGAGRFADASDARLPRGVHDSEDIAAADFDGDGDVDLVSVSEDDAAHELYLNDGRGTFADASARIPVATVANAVQVIDLDGDRDVDIVIGNAGRNTALLNDGHANFRDATADVLPPGDETTQDLAFGDVDGDEDLDLVEGNEDGNRLLLNDGSGRFTVAPAGRLPLPPAGEETRGVELGDVDGDDDLDVFVANVYFARQRPPQDRLLLNDGTGAFRDVTATHLPVVGLNTAGAAMADLDGDGAPDLALAYAFGGSHAIWRNDGTGRFADVTADLVPAPVRGDGVAVATADVDRDGIVDIYLTNYTGRDFLLVGERTAPPRRLLFMPWAEAISGRSAP